MASEYTPEKVEQVVLATYHVADQGQREQAIQWLHAFSRCNEAWSTTLTLVGSSTHDYVQFFCSNILYTKLQKEWTVQSDEFKEEMYNQVMVILGSYVQDTAKDIAKNAIQRICLSLATMAVLSPHIVDSYIEKVTGILQIALGGAAEPQASGGTNSRSNSPTMALNSVKSRAFFIASELLMILPEERDNSNLPKRADASMLVTGGLQQHLERVLSSVLHMINHISSTQPSRGFGCLQSWAPIGITLHRLRNEANEVYSALLTCLSSPSLEVTESSANAFIAVVKVPSPKLMLTGVLSDEEVDSALQTAGTLANVCRPSLIRAVEKGEHAAALAICRAISNFAEINSALIAGGNSPVVLELAKLLLDCTQYPDRAVSGCTLDFWLSVQDVPMEERHTSFREPCYIELLKILIIQCGFDKGSLNPSDLDYQITHFREIAQDVFVSTFFALKEKYFEEVLKCLEESATKGDWVRFEAVIFACTAVASDVIGFLKEPQRGGPHLSQVRDAVGLLMTKLPTNPIVNTNALTIIGVCNFIGNYSKLVPSLHLLYKFQNSAPNIIQCCFQCIITGLSNDDVYVQESAATSIQRLCLACTKDLASFPALVAHLAQASCSPKLSLKPRVVVLEGLTRCGKFLPTGMRDELFGGLVNPSLTRLREKQGNSEIELKVLKSFMLYADVVHVKQLMQQLWPILEGLYGDMEAMKREEIVESVFDIFSTCFITAADVMQSKLVTILQCCVDSFDKTHNSHCIQCISKAIEFYPDNQNDAPLQEILPRISHSVINMSGTPTEHPDILGSFFELVYLYFVFKMDMFLRCAELDKILSLASVCVTAQETEVMKQVLTLFETVLKKMRKDNNVANNLQNGFNNIGAHLTHQLTVGLIAKTPIVHIQRLARILKLLLLCFNTPGLGWTEAALKEVETTLDANDLNKVFRTIGSKVQAGGEDLEEFLVGFAEYHRGLMSLPALQAKLL